MNLDVERASLFSFPAIASGAHSKVMKLARGMSE
jgi:hypothetical protein